MSTLASVFVLASEAAGEEEKSAAPFYVAGIVLAVWAVLVSVIGMTQAEFPKSSGQKNAVMGISAILTVGTLISVIISS